MTSVFSENDCLLVRSLSKISGTQSVLITQIDSPVKFLNVFLFGGSRGTPSDNRHNINSPEVMCQVFRNMRSVDLVKDSFPPLWDIVTDPFPLSSQVETTLFVETSFVLEVHYEVVTVEGGIMRGRRCLKSSSNVSVDWDRHSGYLDVLWWFVSCLKQ